MTNRLIDRHLPRWDVRERHATRVRATPERVYAALRTADLAGHPLVGLLLALRSLPAALLGGRATPRRDRGVNLAAFERHGFSVIAEDPPRELLIGLEGRFWTPRGDLRPVDAATFAEPPRPGYARAAWSFTIEPHDSSTCRLATETRVLCADAHARRRFLPYWMLVRPGSGLIRRLMLRAIRAEAERTA